jgi:hypothetical protein
LSRLALIVSQRYSDLGALVLSIVVGTTIVFELLGPLITRFALRHAGKIAETNEDSGSASPQE